MVRKAKEESLLLGFFGAGEVAPEEIEAQLDDFLDGQPEDVTFIVPITKVHFSDTMQAIIEYANGGETPIPYEAVTDEVSAKARNLSKYLKGAEKVHQVARIGQKVVSRLSQVDNGLLTVIWDDEDDELAAVCNGAVEKDIEAFDLTSGMGKVEFEDDGKGDDEGSENEPDDEPKPKSATKAAKDDDDDEPESGKDDDGGGDDDDTPYTADELEKADLDTLKAICGDYEIEVPPRTRATTLRTLILEHQEREAKRADKAKEALAGVTVEAEVDYDRIADIVRKEIELSLEPDGLLDTAFGEIVSAYEEVNKTLLSLVEAIEAIGSEPNVVEPEDEPEPEEKPASTTRRRRRI